MRARLFIYGTLKRGQVSHHLLNGQRFLGEAETVPAYRLLDLGWYPGLAECECEGRGRRVRGEVWEIDSHCLAILDDYEGSEYVRKPVRLESDASSQSWIGVESYLLRVPDVSKPEAGTAWP